MNYGPDLRWHRMAKTENQKKKKKHTQITTKTLLLHNENDFVVKNNSFCFENKEIFHELTWPKAPQCCYMVVL